MNKIENLSFGLAHPSVPGMTKDAVGLVNHFYKQDLMLPADLGHYEELAEQGKLAVAINVADGVVGTAAYSQEYPGGIWEIGGMAVEENWQKIGAGFKLLVMLAGLWKHKNTIAFANSNSESLLQKFGVVEVSDYTQVPDEALELCDTCPNKPDQGCCDTIYSLTPGILKVIEEGYAYKGKLPYENPEPWHHGREDR